MFLPSEACREVQFADPGQHEQYSACAPAVDSVARWTISGLTRTGADGAVSEARATGQFDEVRWLNQFGEVKEVIYEQTSMGYIFSERPLRP